MDTLSKRTSKSCMKTIHIGNNIYIHNIQSELLIITFFSFFVAIGCGMIQEIVNSELDELYGIDIWSIAHFSMSLGIYTLFLVIFKKNSSALIFAILITTLWEVFEYILSDVYHLFESFSAEITSNQIMDIVFNCAGILLGYFLYRNRLCFE